MTDPAAGQPVHQPTRNRTSSITHSIASFTEDLVLNRDPAPGFFAAAAQATSKAPTLAEIRRGSFGEEGWGREQHPPGAVRRGSGHGQGSGSIRDKRRSLSGGKKGSRDGQLFAPLSKEPNRISEGVGERSGEQERGELEERDLDGGILQHPKEPIERIRTAETDRIERERKADTSIREAHDTKHMQRIYSSGYIPPRKLPWTQSWAIAFTAFGKWFITPFGFFVTIYGLNVVAWGGMLFLLLCNASPAMCHAPIPTEANNKNLKLGSAEALNLPGPYYFNCNDINAPRRIWIEINSQTLNALFCVTGLGLVPWRFRDLYYILRFRFANTKKQGLEGKLYGLRVLAGIHRGWFRLPGSETLDTTPSRDYLRRLEKTTTSPSTSSDIESNTSSQPERDLRVPVPLSKRPADPVTSVRAPPTKVWLMDFFIWCQIWNTIFQCFLCGFMWGYDRYDRPPWTTGLFVALACIIAGVGGVVSFAEGRKVKRVEGVAPDGKEGAEMVEGGGAMRLAWDGATDRESVYEERKGKGRGS